LTEKELIKACCKRDRKAQHELFKRHKDSLFLLCCKYCRNEIEAEDTLHDVFITIFNKIKTYKGTGSFEGWMKRIAIFKAIDVFKSKEEFAIEINDDILEDTTEADSLEQVPLDIILKTIQELPDQYRLVFNLYQLDGYTHKEVGDILSISEGTSKSNYHRAKLILRNKLSRTFKTNHHGA